MGLSLSDGGRAVGRGQGRVLACLMVLVLPLCGCTSLQQYVQNGFKVGPSYSPPAAPVAQHWIDEADKRIRTNADDLSQWWTVFHDPG